MGLIEHQRLRSLRIAGGEGCREHAGSGQADQGSAGGAHGVQDGDNVVHTLVERGQLGADPVRQAGATPVKLDEPAKRGNPLKHMGQDPLLPVILNVGMPGTKQHHVRRAIPRYLVSDRQAIHGARVTSLGNLHTSNRLGSAVTRQ